jgi:hypothetical protein
MQMTRHSLTLAINKILRDESRYATGLEKGGDFGRAKLVRAAIDGVRRALKTAAAADESAFVGALRDALIERRAEYREDWDDPDGMGTSTFFRALNLFDEDEP